MLPIKQAFMPGVGHKMQFEEAVRSVHGVDVREALRLLSAAGMDDALAAGGSVDLQQVIDGLCALSSQDGLTGLANRRSFWSALEREIGRSARAGEIFGLLMLDIDHFKRVNDTWGHLAGDQVLRSIAAVLTDDSRSMDTVARFGGEEFAVILPDSTPAHSRQVAERVRARIEREHIRMSAGEEISVTASIGVACSSAWSAREASDLVAAADRNLYKAKREGRNRVCCEPQANTALTSGERELLLGVVE